MNDIRSVYKKVKMEDLKPDDEFILFEETGEPVTWDGKTKFVCTSDPYKDNDETWTVKVDKV